MSERPRAPAKAVDRLPQQTKASPGAPSQNAGDVGLSVAELQNRVSRYALRPARGFRVRRRDDDAFELIQGRRVVQVFQAGNVQSMKVHDGYEIDPNGREVRRFGKPVATLLLHHELNNDAFWGGRKNANSLRYHANRGGVHLSIDSVILETDASVMMMASWRASALSAGVDVILYAVIRISVQPRVSVQVLQYLEGEYGEWGSEVPILVHGRRVLIHHGGKTQSLVPINGNRG